MKFSFFLTVTLGILIVSGCKKEAPKDEVLTVTTDSDTTTYSIERILRVEEGCGGDTCARIEINYVSLNAEEEDTAAQNINNLILDDLRGKEYTNIIAYANGFLREYAQDKADIPDMAPWSAESNQQVINNSPSALCVKTTYYNYTGGAHGLYGTLYQNFNPITGKAFTKEDVFSADKESELLDIAEEFFRKDMAIGSQEDIGEAGYDFEDNQFNLPDNFGLLKNGIVFTYGLYEIASYAQGEQEFFIPYSALEGVMN